MKKIFVLVAFFTFFIIGNSMALTLPALGGSYQWSNADYWTITDLAGSQGLFELSYENSGAVYESSFGLYTVNAVGDTIANRHEIFSALDEPGSVFNPTTASVWFSYDSDSSIWQISNASDGVYSDFGLTFGFYSDIYTSNSSEVSYSFYTDVQFNTEALERVFVAYDDENHDTMVFVEDTINGSSPLDLMVESSDLQPVPEPGTLLLLGSGLIGLAYLKRRKT